MALTDSVRLALPSEAAQLAALERACWAEDPQQAELGAQLPTEEIAAAWQHAILRPPLAQFRVLVAVSRDDKIVGFAAIGPSEDPDAEPDDGMVGEFMIDPQRRGAGHGSRLLNAVVDTMRSDGFRRATWWVRSADDALRAFLGASNWEPDGAHREVGTPDGALRVKQLRHHTLVS